MILKVIEFGNIDLGILHVCGGDPSLEKAQALVSEYSPRMWR